MIQTLILSKSGNYATCSLPEETNLDNFQRQDLLTNHGIGKIEKIVTEKCRAIFERRDLEIRELGTKLTW